MEYILLTDYDGRFLYHWLSKLCKLVQNQSGESHPTSSSTARAMKRMVTEMRTVNC